MQEEAENKKRLHHSDRDYKTRSIKDYDRDNEQNKRQASPAKLEPDDLQSDTFSDIDDKMVQYRQRKNLVSKPLSSAAASGKDSRAHEPPPHPPSKHHSLSKRSLKHSTSSQVALGKASSVPSCSQPPSVGDRNSARGEPRETKGTVASKSQRIPADVKEYINSYKSENQHAISHHIDSSPEATERGGIEDEEVIVDIGRGRDKVRYRGEDEVDGSREEAEKLSFSQTYDLDLNAQQRDFPGTSHNSMTKTEATGFGQNIKISTLLHKHSERQRSKQAAGENQSSFNGDRTLTSQDQWALTSKFCVEDVTSAKKHLEDSRSAIDDQTVEKAYESKKIQEYAERALEQQHSTHTDFVAQNKLIDTSRPSNEEILMTNEYTGDTQQHRQHSTNKGEAKQAGKIIKQLYRSSFTKPESSFPALSSSTPTAGGNLIEPNEYRTNISSLYLKEEAPGATSSHGAFNTAQNQLSSSQSPMNIAQLNRRKEEEKKMGRNQAQLAAEDSKVRQSRSDLQSPQLSFVDSTLENDTSQRKLKRSNNQNCSKYLDSIDVLPPSQGPNNQPILEEEINEKENSSDEEQSQSSLKINDILKYKKLPGIPKGNAQELNPNAVANLEEQRIQKMVKDFDEIRTQHQEMQNSMKIGGLYPNRPHQRSVQSTIHEVSNGCQIEEAADMLLTNQKDSTSHRARVDDPGHPPQAQSYRQPSHPYENLDEHQRISERTAGGEEMMVPLKMVAEGEHPSLEAHDAIHAVARANNIKFLDDDGSEIDVQIEEQDAVAEEPQRAQAERWQPVLQVFENPKYRHSTAKVNHSRQSSIKQNKTDDQAPTGVPDQNLMVVCFIKSSKNQSKGGSNTRWNAPRSSTSKSNPRQNRFSQAMSSNRMSSVASERSKSVYSARSARNGRELVSNRQSCTSSMFSFSECNNDLTQMSLTNPINQSTILKKKKLQERMKGPTFFTTQKEASQLVFQQLQTLSASYRPSDHYCLSKNLIQNTLRYAKDCPTFLAGTFKQGKLDTLDEQPDQQQRKGANLRLFSFDKCLSECQHPKKAIEEARKCLRDWLIHSKVNQTIDSVFPFNDADDPILKFCFMFGSQATQKSEELNLMNKHSLIQEFLNDMVEPIRYLQISMFFQDQEFVLNNREFDSNKQSKREIGMEIREALRDRARLVNKLTEQQPGLALFIQKCSHFKIQLNNYVFIDMADLRGLQFFENEEVVATLTNDFGSMTNEILRQSIYYRDHSFQINEDQQLSSFNQFLRNNIQPQSKIMLLTFISNESEELVSSQIALDFSHKIRQYFSGQSDECAIKSIIDSNKFNHDPVLLTEIFEKVDQIFMQVEMVRKEAQKIAKKVKNPQNQVSKICFKKMVRDFTNLKEKFARYQLSIEQSLEKEINRVLSPDMFADFNLQISREISTIKDELRELGTNINKLSNRVLSLNPARPSAARPTSNSFLSKNRSGMTSQVPKAQAGGNQNQSHSSKRRAGYNPAERSLSQKSSQVSLQNYNPIRTRVGLDPKAEPMALGDAGPYTGTIQNSTKDMTSLNQASSEMQTLVNLPIGPQIVLEPQSLPQTEDSFSQKGRPVEDLRNEEQDRRHHRRNTSNRMSKTQQKKSSARLSRPKTSAKASSRGSRKDSKKDRKPSNGNAQKLQTREQSLWRKQKVAVFKTQQEAEGTGKADQENGNDVKARDNLSKDIDESLKIIKSRHSAISSSKTRSFHKASNIDLENVAFNADTFSQNDLQIIPEKQSANSKEQTRKSLDKDHYDQSTSVLNPFDHDSTAQAFASQPRPSDLTAPPAEAYADLSPHLQASNNAAIGHNHQALQPHHVSAPSDPNSLHLLQNSYKSIDLLEATTTKNHMHVVQQLQEKVHQLQQQLSFQKKEFDMRIEEKVMHSIQSREDLLQQLTTTKKELDNTNKEKRQLVSRFEGKTMQLKQQAKEEIEKAKREAKVDAKNVSIERIRKQVHSEVRQQVKSELFQTIKTQARNELTTELRREIEKELKPKLYQKARKELFNQVYAEVQDRVRERARQEIVKELRAELRKEIQEEIMKESNFNQLNFEMEQQQKANQKLQSENSELKKKVKEMEGKIKKQENSKKNQEKVEQLQSQIELLQDEKENIEATNKQILMQVGLMKETVKEQKERELLNIKLHEKLRDKQSKIDDLKQREKHYVEQIETMSEALAGSKEEHSKLNSQIAELQNQIQQLTEQLDQDQMLREDHESMESQIEELKGQLAAKKKQAQEQSLAYQDQIEELKCARDRYRQQVLDQKQEVRKLKKTLSSQEQRASSDPLTSSTQTQRQTQNQS